MNEKDKQLVIFESYQVRRTWNHERWYFVVEDVVQALVETTNIKDYINKMRQRDLELGKGYGQIVHTLTITTSGGPQKMNCADLAGIFRIIQSIPSPKAEPFKLWLAKVGKERIEEIKDPELAMKRAKAIFEKKGYPKNWIDKRMRGIGVRNTLTDEWKNRGVKEPIEFAILTDEIYKGTFDLTAKEYKEHKSLDHDDNLRDHMEDLELILTMLGEATTTKLTTERNSEGFPKLQGDAKEGGGVAGRARSDIEKHLGKNVVSKDNFLPSNKKMLK